jgi:electron transfer flavoprotein alpha/beta subunit
MKVFVQVWCEIDPTLNVRIDRQTSQPVAEPGDQLRRASLLGRAGVAAAAKLRPASLTAFALGAGHADALRYALAAGATRAIELTTDGPDGEAFAPAALADWFAAQAADLLIADRLAGLIAARLGWSHLAGLEDLQAESSRLRALRVLGRGDRERVSARLPAAVRLQSDSRAPYVSRARLEAVAAQPIERIVLPAAPALPAIGPVQINRPRARVSQTPAPAAGSASDRLQALMGGNKSSVNAGPRAAKTAATPDQLAEEFVRYLLHHGLLPIGKR